MADNKFKRRFYNPVYKDQTNAPDEGVLIEAGDTLQVLLNAQDGTKPLQNLTVLAVSEDAREITFEYDAGNQYARPEDIFAVAPKHQYTCPEARNIGLIADDDITVTVTSVTINGTETTGLSFPVTLDGAAELQAWLAVALNDNGEPTVVYVDAATDYLQIYVTNTTATVEVNGTELADL